MGRPPAARERPSWLSTAAAAVLQDAGLGLTPVASRLCTWCSLACLGLAIGAHFSYEYHDTRPAVGDEDPGMQWALQFAATLALGGLIYEACLAIAIRVMGLQPMYMDDLTFRRRLRLNRMMLVCFACLTTFYHLMAFDIQYVHKGWLAERHGGHQIVYSVRYVEWITCAPIVLSISGQLEHAPDGTPRNGIIPSSLLTGIYCIISWQAIVVKDQFAGWALIAVAFTSYFVASVEQLAFAWYIKDKGRAGPLRAGLLIYIVIMLGVYGIVYLLPIPGWISATLENKFYCFGDISFKLGTSIMLLASNDLANNDEMRRRAEATAEDLQRLVHTASVPIFGVDRDCQVDQWNRRAAELTGLPEEKALGRSILSVIGSASHQEGEALVRRALEGRETGTAEITLEPELKQEASGDSGLSTRQALLILSAAPRKDKAGEVTGVTLIGCDLTEVQAYKEAECRKNRFMAVVSHELRSPLYGIIGLMKHLTDKEQDVTKVSLFTMVQNCGSRLLELVTNIMEMASLAKKDLDNKPQTQKALARDPVEIPKIIEEIVTLVNSSRDKRGNLLVKRGVSLINEVKAVPIIEADAHKCTQVFYNLITNACKFTAKGQIVVASSVDPQGRWVEVSVADTGKGIARQSLERIFQPFEQESAESRHSDGIGLGLAIAQEVVRRHGGHITVQSEVGVGSTFTVRLPLTAPHGGAGQEGGEAEGPAPAEAGGEAVGGAAAGDGAGQAATAKPQAAPEAAESPEAGAPEAGTGQAAAAEAL